MLVQLFTAWLQESNGLFEYDLPIYSSQTNYIVSPSTYYIALTKIAPGRLLRNIPGPLNKTRAHTRYLSLKPVTNYCMMNNEYTDRPAGRPTDHISSESLSLVTDKLVVIVASLSAVMREYYMVEISAVYALPHDVLTIHSHKLTSIPMVVGI